MKKFLIKVNGNQYEVEVEEVMQQGSSSGVAASAPAAPAVSVPVAQPAAKVETAPAAAGETVVKAPMPGTILKLNVSVGSAVKEGQVLLVLEAMKMENEIVSPVNGKITAIKVAKGSQVSAGDVMVVIG